MKPADYLFAFRKITEEMCALTAAKNKDYSGDHDAFANFRLVEQIGLCPTEVGILTRLSDKLARVGRLLNKPAAVKTESVEDTLLDMATYSIILLVYLRQKTPSVLPQAYIVDPRTGAKEAISEEQVAEIKRQIETDSKGRGSAAPHAFYSTHEDEPQRETDEEYYRRHGNRMKRPYDESDEAVEAAARLAR